MLTTSNGTNTRKPHAALRPTPTRKLKKVSIKFDAVGRQASEHGKHKNSLNHFHRKANAAAATRFTWAHCDNAPGARPSAFAARHSAASARRRSGRFSVGTA